MGELWLERHLDKVGKSKEDLAKALFERNLTAVAEVCFFVPFLTFSTKFLTNV